MCTRALAVCMVVLCSVGVVFAADTAWQDAVYKEIRNNRSLLDEIIVTTATENSITVAVDLEKVNQMQRAAWNAYKYEIQDAQIQRIYDELDRLIESMKHGHTMVQETVSEKEKVYMNNIMQPVKNTGHKQEIDEVAAEMQAAAAQKVRSLQLTIDEVLEKQRNIK